MFRHLLFAAALVCATPAWCRVHTLDISIDGFCNTFSLIVDGSSITGTRGGCNDFYVEGGFVAKVAGIPVYNPNDSDAGELYSWLFTKPKSGHGTWQLYTSNGTAQKLQSSGTYTVKSVTVNNTSMPSVVGKPSPNLQ